MGSKVESTRRAGSSTVPDGESLVQPRPPWSVAPLDVLASVVVLFNFAVAQPLLDLLGRNPPFFIAHDLGRGELLVLALFLSVGLPLAIAVTVLGLWSRWPRAGRTLHFVVLSLLATTLTLVLTVSWLNLPGVPTIVAALVIGGVVALTVLRFRTIRIFLRITLVGPLLFVLVFLFLSPASALLHGEEGGAMTQTGTVAAPVPVVLLVLDEFPLVSLLDAQGEIDETRYPNFARLADQSNWYRNATTVHTSTTFALPSILTGNLPREGALPISQDHPDNLFRLLEVSHDLVAVEPVSQFCPVSRCQTTEAAGANGGELQATVADLIALYGHLALPEGLRGSLPEVDGQWADFRGGTTLASEQHVDGASSDREELRAAHQSRFQEVPRSDKIAEFREFVGTLQPRDRPTFYFGHVMMPHAPWTHLATGDSHVRDLRPAPGRADSKTWGTDEWYVAHSHRRHLLQVALTDRLLGEFLDRLEDAGLLDEAVVAVVSDHGTTFEPGANRRSPEKAVIGEVAYVPFFIKAPGQRVGRTIDDAVQITDLAPTIMDLLDVADAPPTDGRSLLDPQVPPRDSFQIAKGTRVEEFSTGGDDLTKAVERKYRRFPLAQSPNALFQFGPFGTLVGERMSGVSTERSALTVVLEDGESLRDVTPGSGFVPALVRGTLEGCETLGDEPAFLALSLHGAVAGIAKSYREDDGDCMFETLLDPTHIQEGRNSLEIHQLIGPSRSPTLLLVDVVDS